MAFVMQLRRHDPVATAPGSNSEPKSLIESRLYGVVRGTSEGPSNIGPPPERLTS